MFDKFNFRLDFDPGWKPVWTVGEELATFLGVEAPLVRHLEYYARLYGNSPPQLTEDIGS